MKLISRYESKFGCFGDLYDENNEHICFTLERNYANNEPNISSVPPGDYELRLFNSKKHGQCLVLVNENLGVHVFKNAKCIRHSILFHPANNAVQLQGCIAPGMDVGVVNGHWGVINSKEAMAEVMKAFKQGDNLLRIERR